MIWNDDIHWGANAGWSRFSGAQQVPGMAFVPQTGQWVRISAQAVGSVNYPPELGSWAVATNRLGKWDPPSLLPRPMSNEAITTTSTAPIGTWELLPGAS